MEVKVTKLTDVSLLRLANSYTSGKESNMSLATAYKHKHSPIRTQIFVIELRGIPLFVASQLVRSHVGIQWYQRSKRPDRGGEDFREVCKGLSNRIKNQEFSYEDISNDIKILPMKFDRNAPTDLLGIMNAEAIINISHKRLCRKTSKETREIWKKVCDELYLVDSALAKHCVPQCVYCGFCPEPQGCGLIKSPHGEKMREDYLKLYER